MIYLKRGTWCYRAPNNRLFKFETEEEAIQAAGSTSPIEASIAESTFVYNTYREYQQDITELNSDGNYTTDEDGEDLLLDDDEEE